MLDQTALASESKEVPVRVESSGERVLRELPRCFGDYEILAEIGRGGMGTVFKARQISLNRQVALKVISASPWAADELLRRFHGEAEAAAKLSHPNIVPVHEIGENGGEPYFTMALIEGSNLRDSLRQNRCPWKGGPAGEGGEGWTPLEAARVVRTLARAVHYAHARGVLHRDIKPSNVLLDGAGEPHLIDFGLAKLMEAESTLTRSHAVLGTLAYLAPEQARGDPSGITTATDIYGLGAVLYEILGGHPPFLGDTPVETIRQVLEDEPRPPSALVRFVDRDLETICLKCLDKDPSRRYSSAAALADDLDRWLRREPIQARPATLAVRVQKWVLRRPAVTALGGLLVVAVLAGSIVSISQWRAQIHARTREEREKSRALVILAEQLLRSSVMSRARDMLRLVPPAFRHWEWGHVLGQSALTLRSFKGHRSAVDAAAFASDGSRLATGDREGRVCVWDFRSGTSPLRLTAEGELRALAFIGEGSELAGACADGTCIVWDLQSRTERRRWVVLPSPDYVHFSADGTRLVAGTAAALVVCDTARGLEITPSIAYPPHDRGAVFAGNGERLAVASSGGYAICETDSARLVCRVPIDIPTRPTFSFTPDGRRLFASLASGALSLFDAETGALLRNTPVLASAEAPGVLFSPDGQWLATRDSDFGIQTWDGRSFEKLRHYVWDEMELFLSAISPDGQWMASGSIDGLVRVWQVETAGAIFPHPSPVTAAALAHDDLRLVTGCSDGSVALWRTDTGERLWTIQAHSQSVSGLALSSHDAMIATSSSDRTARLWSPNTGRPLVTLQHECAVPSVCFLPGSGGRFLVTGGTDGAVRMWNRTGGHSLERWPLHDGPISKMAVSSAGTLLATGAPNGQVVVFDLERKRILRSFSKQSGRISALAFDPTGARLVISAITGTRIWDLSSGRAVLELRTHGECGGAGFSPDGQRLFTASGCPNGRRGHSLLEVWDTTDGRQALSLSGRDSVVGASAFSSDSLRIFVGGSSGSIIRWEALPWWKDENLAPLFKD